MTNTIHFSNDFLKRRFKFLVAVFAPILLFVAIVPWFQDDVVSAKYYLAVLLFMLLVVGGTLALQWYLFKSYRALFLEYDETELIKVAGKIRQCIAWETIQHVVVYQTPTGKPRMIHLDCSDGQKFKLFGFHQMETLTNIIQERVEPHVQWTTKRDRLDWESPVSGIVCGIIGTVIGGVVLWGTLDYSGAREWLMGGWLLLLSGYFLGVSPLSKINPNHKKFDYGFGIAILCTGILLLYALFTAPHSVCLSLKIVTQKHGQLTEQPIPSDVSMVYNLAPGALVGVPHRYLLPLKRTADMRFNILFDDAMLEKMLPPDVLIQDPSHEGLTVEPANTKFGKIVFYSFQPGKTPHGPLEDYGEGLFLFDQQANTKFWILYADRASHITGTILLDDTIFSVNIHIPSAGFLPVRVSKVKETEYEIKTVTLSDELYFVIRKDEGKF
ncbi:MAG: hypothetical protein GY799_31535 [Desulfobulbaceae bacterium]|nr:hypothetical protein [Desulfobulbaceae bacterium]